MFRKILIANRGEIACRIARTCHRLGVVTCGVHSAADRDALHVRAVGESIEIGGAAAADSYLKGDAIIAAALQLGAQAIHPGFGFLAENAAFARAVEAAGLVFIGPAPETIERLGDKAAAKDEARAAGIPIVPGSERPSAAAWELARLIQTLRLPVLLKAAAGGGGKGMRIVTSLDGLEAEIESAMREARNAFGDPRLIVEQFIEHGRHIEIQIAGDGRGTVAHLFERECSLQRRHQKIIEEAPAANLAAALRDRMAADAVRLGERLRYRGVGTVEFIVQGDTYYFLEVNPRLQVEHPVTEMVTGLDIVEIMLRVSAGEPLPVRQQEVTLRGHAVEARIYAEDPAQDFMPSTGPLVHVEMPLGVRVETGIETGMEVTPYYDPMLAKLIAWAETREEALDRLALALDEVSVLGVQNNIAFLKLLLDLPETRAATFHTRLIDERMPGWRLDQPELDLTAAALAAYSWLLGERAPGGQGIWSDPAMTGWHMSEGGDGLACFPAMEVGCGTISAPVSFSPLGPDGMLLTKIGEDKVSLALQPLGGDRYLAIIGTRREVVRIARAGGSIYVQTREGSHALTVKPYLSFAGAASEASGQLRAPMMGMILAVNYAVGDRVEAGSTVVALESMKMELRVKAEMDGIVTQIHCQVGETVERNTVVAIIEAG